MRLSRIAAVQESVCYPEYPVPVFEKWLQDMMHTIITIMTKSLPEMHDVERMFSAT